MVTTITVSLVGTALLILTVLDVIATAMGASGGVLVRHLTPLMWRIGCLPCSLGGWHRYRSRLGICIVLTTITLWLVSFWFGWVLVFHGSPEAVVNTETELPASTLERAYFVGFTVSTLGLGDFKAGGQLWKILTVVCSTSGFLLVTFVITYLIPLIQAATHQRAVAVRISAIGESADQIVRRCYDGAGLRALEDHLTDLSSELALLEKRHHTYPVLYYMHSIAKPESIALSIAALDEAMTIVELGLVDRGGVGEPQLEHARQIVTQYLHTLGAVSYTHLTLPTKRIV